MTRLEEMKALATEEAIKLKEHATKEELARLNLFLLNPYSPKDCIYGQMTGNCNSKRAQLLIMECAERVYDVMSDEIDNLPPLNGRPYLIDRGNENARMHEWQSPIEVLLYDDTGGEFARQKLIAFLKDETQTLEL